MKLPKNLGMLCLEIYLIIVGALGLLGGASLSLGTLVSVLALAAGILLLLDK